MNDQLIYLGTYTMPILFGTGEVLQGQGKGIHLLRLNTETGQLTNDSVARDIPNPSFLTQSRDGRFLYAVNELKEYNGEQGGSVSAFSVDAATGGLTLLNTEATGGQDPCHVCLDKDGRHLIVSNFMTGSVCVYAIEADGSLGRRTAFLQHEGSSADPKRQAGPHAHSATFDPRHGFVLVPDLGLDQLVAYTLNPADGSLSPAPVPHFTCASGSGPRYCEFHPTLPVCYLINELASSVTVLQYDYATAGMTALQTISTLPDTGVASTCADLHVTPDGRFVYGSNRGHDSLMVYAVDSADGTLTVVENVPTGGRTPRQFSLVGDFVLVGNQDTANIVVFRRDTATGKLTQLHDFPAPTPVCVLAAQN